MSFPFQPRDWVSDSSDRVALVRAVYEVTPGEVLLDLVIYNHLGGLVGRTTPACGGPRNFEPACPAEGWERIEKPRFPIGLKWISGPDGRAVARMWAGDRLPPANWTPPRRRAAPAHSLQDADLRAALRLIAEGHNDPRELARRVLKKCSP